MWPRPSPEELRRPLREDRRLLHELAELLLELAGLPLQPLLAAGELVELGRLARREGLRGSG